MLYPLSYGGRERRKASSGGTARVGRQDRRKILDSPLRGVPSTSLVTMAASPDRPARILVVDDDEVIRQLICVNLELEGFEVFTAVDGQDCLDKVGEVAPDVVTLDVMMPRLDGWETAARLRSLTDIPPVKVVLLSARAQEADIERGTKIGVDAYLTKPFDPDDLVDMVRRLAGEATSS